MERVLVTGCAGFIGSHLTESLLGDGIEVVGIDCFNDNYGRRQKLDNLAHCSSWDALEFIPIDLARGDLEEIVADVDAVFHLAAEPGVRSSWGGRFEIYARNNVLATQQLLDAARHRPEIPFVYASSSSIYGQAAAFPTHESAQPRPLSPYGVTKLAAEHLCHLYHVNYGLATTALRYFTVFGPRQRPDMAFNIFCRAALEGKSIEVFGDGSQTRDFTYVSDVVAATRAAASSPVAAGRLYNVGGGFRSSLGEALSVIGELAACALDIRYLDWEAGDVHDTGADTEQARMDLGFAPQTGLREGLSAELDWMQAALRA
jgi:UDP-glucuronate 4-epimerase